MTGSLQQTTQDHEQVLFTLHFPLVFIGIFRLFGTKCGYSLGYQGLQSSAEVFWMTLHK